MEIPELQRTTSAHSRDFGTLKMDLQYMIMYGVVMRGKCHGVLFFLVLSQQLGTETSRVVFTEWEAAQK